METGHVAYPNVVLVLTDDQGWGDLSRTGNTNLRTPNIDRLAADGATMEWFYVQPLCAPTRAEILTGRCYPRTGVKGVCLGAERLNLDEVTIADLFRTAGYRTGCFGKWHSGQQYPYHPNGRGFEEFVGYCCGHWSHYFDSTIEHNGVEFRSSGYLTDVLTDHAIRFIEDNREHPFFCYVPLNTPHSPFQVPDAYFDRFRGHGLPLRATRPEEEDLEATRAALAMCENIDWNVGRLVDCLETLGLTQNTIVVYLSDNGPNTWRWNGMMAGRKGSSDEGGVRSPCSITWPAQIRPGTVIDRIAGAIDLLPTLSECCGVDMSATQPLDGRSLFPLLTGRMDSSDWPDRRLFARETNARTVTSVRTQEFRAGGRSGGLFRLAEDIGQQHDLAHDLPEVRDGLLKEIETWAAEMPVSEVYSALPVGYEEFPHAYIPTQDASLKGGLKRSSIHPNCSYIMEWTDPDASITWDLDVKNAGAYEVTLMYACPAADVGSRITVTAGQESIQARITEAFDPPVLDQDDRVPRSESYEKAFRPLCLGNLFIPAGRQTLVLRCLEQAGRPVAEVRALKLTYLS